jgi:hypothetical protein
MSGANRLAQELNRSMTRTTHHKNPRTNDADHDKDELSGIDFLLVVGAGLGLFLLYCS